MNCLTGFVKRRAEKYTTNAQLSHVFTRYFQNLWFKRTHFNRACTIAVQAGIDVEMYTNKQTFIQSFIQSSHTNIIWLLQGTDAFHEKEPPLKKAGVFFKN